MKILLGIVHNNEQERLDYLLNELPKLQNPGFYFQIIDYGIQVEKSINLVSTLKKTFSVLDYTIRWAKYTKQSIFKKLKGEVRTQMSFMLGGKAGRKKLRKINIICDAVSRKHFGLMEDFLEGDAEYLIVLESDALLPDPVKMNQSLALLTLSQSSDFPLWVSFVQPNPKSQGEIKGFLDSASGLITQEKPWSNTACAYMVNRKLASLFINKHSNRINSKYPALPIDWLLNSTFLHLTKAELESGRYFEFDTGPVIHGSIQTSSSWTQGLI